VHQLLRSFLQSESAEQWIKSISLKQSGRDDMIALRNHYSGEGNTSRRIAIAEKTRDTLHYKSERAMTFSSFLDKLQKMFNIFVQEGEPISESAKVRLLLKKIEHPQLQDTIGALRVRSAIEGITFTECANHLAALVSELPDQQSTRKISGAHSDRHKYTKKDPRGGKHNHKNQNGSKRKGIHMPDGTIWTGHYDEWSTMSDKDKQTVIDARAKNRSGKGNKRQTPDRSSISGINTKLDELQRSISTLSTKSESVTDCDSAPGDNAGDSFGGRSAKKSKKE
jgi:hypothetical protein